MSACGDLVSLNPKRLYGAWDINDLHFRPSIFTDGNKAGYAPDTVTVRTRVYFAGEVNYFLLGVAFRAAFDDGYQSFNEDRLKHIIRAYKRVAYPYEAGKGHEGASVAWALAGFNYPDLGVQPPTEWDLPLSNPNPEFWPNTLWAHVGTDPNSAYITVEE